MNMKEGDKVLVFTGRKVTYVRHCFCYMHILSMHLMYSELMMLLATFLYVDCKCSQFMEIGTDLMLPCVGPIRYSFL